MTITYTGEVATCRGFGCFLKLLLRWRGSIYKLVWLDLITFLFLYYLLNIIYRFALNDAQRITFEAVVQYCYKYSDLIPLSFVLGFYVSIVMTRWWGQYTSIPWPDPIAVFISANIHGQDERGRVMRRTIMRYVCLCLTMVLTNISPRVKKRFPNLSHFVEAGLLNDNEKEIIESINKAFPRHSKHWLPIVWATSIITRARKESRIRDDFAVKTIIDELNKFRGQCGVLISYDTVSVPLVYTQVVTLAVYSFFMCSVMGQQWVEGKTVENSNYENRIDLYFPVFTTLQFFFYMGWLKVAESLINPFGEDDDDFEVNWMVDRNLQVSYLIVDEMHHEHPELIKDQYWDEVFPNELPYTVASECFREEHPEPSTAKIEVSKSEAMPSVLSSVRIDNMVGNDSEMKPDSSNVQAVNYKFPDGNLEEEADDASGIHFTARGGHVRPGSSPSLVSLSGTLSRVNTVASALKRFLIRDESRTGSLTPSEENPKYRFPGSESSNSLAPGTNKLVGSMRITDQVIEEVDEQATITSQRTNGNRQNVRDIFRQATGSNGSINKQPSSSDPIDIPMKNKLYMRTQSAVDPNLVPPVDVDALLNASAASAVCATIPNSPAVESTKSLYGREFKDRGSRETVEDIEMRSTNDLIAATNADTTADDFEKLKVEREKERLERQKKLVRQISTAENVPSAIVAGEAAVIIPTSVAAGPQNPPQLISLTLPSSDSNADLLSVSELVTNSTQKSNEDFND